MTSKKESEMKMAWGAGVFPRAGVDVHCTLVFQIFSKVSDPLASLVLIISYGPNYVTKGTYLIVSADPLSPVTNENRTAIGVFLPMCENTTALVYCVMSCVTSK
jgi:hypothetical protein